MVDPHCILFICLRGNKIVTSGIATSQICTKINFVIGGMGQLRTGAKSLVGPVQKTGSFVLEGILTPLFFTALMT